MGALIKMGCLVDPRERPGADWSKTATTTAHAGKTAWNQQ